MVFKTIGFVAALASASLMAQAAVVPPECLIKYEEYGPGSASSIPFEYTNADLDAKYTPLEYSGCVDSIDRTIVNFQFTFGNADGKEKTQTPLVGPPTNFGPNCVAEKKLTSRDFPSKAQITKDGLQVTGFAL